MKNKGVSLIELLIAMAIMSIISLTLILIFTQSFKTYYIQESQTQLQIQTRYSLESINNWVKKSSTVVATYTAQDTTVYTTSTSVLVLKVLSIDASNNLIANTYDYIIFRRNPSNTAELQQITYANIASSRSSGTKIIGYYINALTFTYFDSSNIELVADFQNSVFITSEITSQEVVRGKTNTVNYKTQSKLRNK